MRIAIVGAGYVGLVTGAGLAELGHNVTCVDVDEGRVETLRKGVAPIFEPGLEALLSRNIVAGRIVFTSAFADAIPDADVVFLAVGTPSRRGDGHADLSYVYAATREIAQHLTGFTVVATKSTVPVGTGDEVARILAELRPEADAVVVSNPEFLREGAAIEDFMYPDRVVIGAEDERARRAMAEVYRPLELPSHALVFTSRRTAELTKYAANSFLAMKLSFINEMADLCERTGADVGEIARGMGLDRRIGDAFLRAGPGYGGSCFPKDTLALVKTAQDHDVSLSLIEATISANSRRRDRMVRKIVSACGGTLRSKTVALLGLSFKPNTDDIRDSPAIAIAKGLLTQGARVVAYDPQAMRVAAGELPTLILARDAYTAATGADAVVLATEWDEFRTLDLVRLHEIMSTPIFIDLRNVFRPEQMQCVGMQYVSIGRRSEEKEEGVS